MSEEPEPQQPSKAENQPEKRSPSPERRFVQRQIVQPLIQWMPLGGSSWLFVSFLLKQEWAQVLLTFPVTVVTAVWAAYSQNFVDRLSEIYAEKGKQDADALNNWLTSLNETINWQLSGFEAKYLKLQAKPCQEYTTEGFNPDKTAIPMLEKVFVPLQLSGHQSPDGLTIWDLILSSRKNPTFRQMVIQAQGGFGKTTLLRHISLIYGQGKHHRYQAPKLIPFLLHLRDWRDELSQSPLPTLPELIKNHFLPKLSPSNPLKVPPAWVENLLVQGKALVMFDGFDELPEGQRQQVSHWISQQMQEYDRTTFIVTSRPAGFKDYVAKRPTAPLFVQKFNSDQQERFIRRWYLCQEQGVRSEKYAQQAKEAAERNAQKLLAQLQDTNRPELRAMAENPLLLNMLATFHRFDPGTELPKRRIELYSGICKLQLEDRPRARGIPVLLPIEKSQRILQSLALTMVKQNRPNLAHSDLIGFLRKHSVLKLEDVEAEAFLKYIVQISELLVERELGYYEFPHLSFQGYFAASDLAQQDHATALGLVRENWDKAWWRETILLYTAQLPPRLMAHTIKEACKLGASAAQLAYDCLREYRNPEKLDPGLEQKIKALTGTVETLRYAQLEEYLKTQQWREADQETYRLMITTVDKEEGRWFSSKDFENFPCEDLRTLDQLWVKYSKGKWGFSVQKKIWQDCGSPMNYNSDWEKFGDRVGWRKEGNWVSYDELTFTLENSLTGEFPRLDLNLEWYVDEGNERAKRDYDKIPLFSRKDL